MPAASKVIMTDEYAVLIQERTGLYWILSLEKASLVKTGNIFKKVTPEMIAKGGFPEPILCVNPEKSGTILLSSIEEEYFLTEPDDVDREMYELKQNNPNISHQEWMATYIRRLDEVRARNPYVIWYRIYPESGKIEKLYEPPEGGTFIKEMGKSDYWRPLQDGSVRMGVLD